MSTGTSICGIEKFKAAFTLRSQKNSLTLNAENSKI